MRLLILLALLIQGCAEYKEPVISEELRPYLNKFIQEANARGEYPDTTYLSMEFKPGYIQRNSDGSAILGRCTTGYGESQVEISRGYWDAVSDSDREQLVFHELGHCLLYLQHDDSKEVAMDKDGYAGRLTLPSSIMSTTHFWNTWYEWNRDEYVNRLFKHRTSGLYYNVTPQVVGY